MIYSVHPHAHFRGKSSKFVAYFPDGREQVLLNVPAYDFNWQSTYDLAEPLTVPAGTKVVYTQTYDNSSRTRRTLIRIGKSRGASKPGMK